MNIGDLSDPHTGPSPQWNIQLWKKNVKLAGELDAAPSTNQLKAFGVPTWQPDTLAVRQHRSCRLAFKMTSQMNDELPKLELRL